MDKQIEPLDPEPAAGDCPFYVMIEFKGHRRAWHHNPRLVPITINKIAIVEAEGGEDAGNVLAVATRLPTDLALPLMKVLRSASQSDMQRIAMHRNWEQNALGNCRTKIGRHNLPMRLIDAEYRFDEQKLTFYFTSESRVDFRELVRDLASAFHTRIDLRQISNREEIRRFDSCGICGRRLCCSSFLDNFRTVTAEMAVSQKLMLNAAKLTGCCGKLKCCLSFEAECYTMPDDSSVHRNELRR